MLGNDVVDLADPETRRRHPGFDARVLTRSERRILAEADDPHAMRQLLWAAKESAYKASRRRDPHTVFSPIRFEVELSSASRGRVLHAAEQFQLQISRRGDCIHAVACQGLDPAHSFAGVAPIEQRDPGEVARALALDALGEFLAAPRDALRIRRRGRIPELELRGAATGCPLSLSHHGRFAAFAALPWGSPDPRHRAHSWRRAH